MRKLLILFISILFGCSAGETIIKDKKIEITVPEINTNIKTEYHNFDTTTIKQLDTIFSKLDTSAYIGNVKDTIINRQKIKISAKFVPKNKKIEINIDSYKLDTTVTDTQKIIVKQGTTTSEKIGYMTIGGILAILIIIIIYIKIRK